MAAEGGHRVTANEHDRCGACMIDEVGLVAVCPRTVRGVTAG